MQTAAKNNLRSKVQGLVDGRQDAGGPNSKVVRGRSLPTIGVLVRTLSAHTLRVVVQPECFIFGINP